MQWWLLLVCLLVLDVLGALSIRRSLRDNNYHVYSPNAMCVGIFVLSIGNALVGGAIAVYYLGQRL